ncbi:MAG: 2-isopropylmalate synthase [Campylobacterales bacterium]
MQPERIIILDTTLRDGEQAPGAALNVHEKIGIAKALERLGVDVIEAGFPVAGQTDFEAARQIAAGVKNSIVCAFARAVQKDIDAAAQALAKAARPRIHTFIATSDLHLTRKLKISRQEAIARAIEAVKYARRFTDDVQFSFEDACRSDHGFLKQITDAVIKAGAATINVPDTVGWQLPHESAAMIGAVVHAAEGRAVVSAHVHDDMGLATANTLAAIEAGARQIEVTVNGIGERAGNAALEEVAVILATRMADRFQTGIDTRLLNAVSDEVARVTGMNKAPNKAVVGQNAFSHGSGIHQDGMMKAAGTYEIFSPELVGAAPGGIVLTRHSGSRAVRSAFEAMGARLNEAAFEELYARFKQVSQQHKVVSVEVLASLVQAR